MVTSITSCPRNASSGSPEERTLKISEKKGSINFTANLRLLKKRRQVWQAEDGTQRPFDIPFSARSAADKFFHEAVQPL